MLDDIAYNLLAHEPERATGLGVDADNYADLRSRLEDQSQAGQDAYAATLRADLARIRAVDTGAMDADTRTSFEVVDSAYRTALDGFALPYGDVAVGSWRNAPYVVIQNVGSYLDLPRFMDSTHPIERCRRRAGIRRPAGDRSRRPGWGIGPDDERARQGCGPARFPARQGDRANGTHDCGRDIGRFVRRRFPSPPGRSGPFRQRERGLADGVADTVRGPIAGALVGQLAELQEQRRVASADPGMWAQPDGDEWYDWALRASTTTTQTPDEVHESGLEELAQLHDRMDPILRSIGYTTGTVGERMQALSADPRYKFAEGDPGRAQIMAFIQDRIDWIRRQMPRAFGTLVDPNLEVRRLPLAEEPGAPGAYGGAGSKDGSIPGRMWINLRTTDLHRKYDLADLTFHETIPGHVWEGEYSNRLPLIRSILAFNAFSEGWALYAEQIADELGAYDDFAVGRLGYLQSLAFRACRMVVDTGLHHKRWSRDRAVDFFVTRNGSKRQEVESEVDRYCSWPGQACGYKVGHSEIVRQRALAQTALGNAYDFRAFNDAVILGGNAPLDVLAKNVSRHIAGADSV